MRRAAFVASDDISFSLRRLQKIALERFIGMTDVSASLSLPEWAGGLRKEYDKILTTMLVAIKAIERAQAEMKSREGRRRRRKSVEFTPYDAAGGAAESAEGEKGKGGGGGDAGGWGGALVPVEMIPAELRGDLGMQPGSQLQVLCNFQSNANRREAST
jgi:hypothetical protein